MVSVLFLRRRVVSIICGANLRGFGDSGFESIGCGSLSGLDVMELGKWSCDVAAMVGVLECVDVVSMG